MDWNGVGVPAIAACAALIGLWWHISRARRGDASQGDKLMGALWAAVLVVSGARVLYLVANPDAGKTDAETPAMGTVADPK